MDNDDSHSDVSDNKHESQYAATMLDLERERENVSTRVGKMMEEILASNRGLNYRHLPESELEILKDELTKYYTSTIDARIDVLKRLLEA